jgi:hypothetical protein
VKLTDQPIADPNGSTAMRQAICAFLIVVLPDGSSEVVLDTNQRFAAARPATPKDVYGAVANAAADWQAMKTAEAVMAFQAQLAQQASMQAQIAAIQPNLRQPGT